MKKTLPQTPKQETFWGVDEKKHNALVQNSLKNITNIMHEETFESLDQLKKINRLGLLTVDSQQGRIERNKYQPKDRKKYTKILRKYHDAFLKKNPAEWESEDYVKNVFDKTMSEYKNDGGKVHQQEIVSLRERAYLNAYTPIPLAKELCRILNHHDCVVAYYTDLSSKSKSSSGDLDFFRMQIPVTQSYIDMLGPNVNNSKYPYNFPTTQKDILPQYETDVQVFPSTPKEMKSLGVGMTKRDYKKYAYVTIIDTRYGHHVKQPDGLFNRVIEALKESKKIYF